MNPYPGNVVFHRVPAMNSMVAHSKLVFNRFFWRSLCGWGVSVMQLAWLITWHIVRKTGGRRKTRKTAKKYRSEKISTWKKYRYLYWKKFFLEKSIGPRTGNTSTSFWFHIHESFALCFVELCVSCARWKLRMWEVVQVGSSASGKLSRRSPFGDFGPHGIAVMTIV